MFQKFFIICSLFFIGSSVSVAAEREVVFGPSGATVTKDTSYQSEEIDVSKFENLIFQFDFDTTLLDKTPSLDTLVYGWAKDGVQHELGRIDGLVGADAAEVDSVTIPVEANGVITLYAVVLANTASDSAILSNIMLTGLKKQETTCVFQNGGIKSFVENLKANVFAQNGIGNRGFIGGYVKKEVKNCLRTGIR